MLRKNNLWSKISCFHYYISYKMDHTLTDFILSDSWIKSYLFLKYVKYLTKISKHLL